MLISHAGVFGAQHTESWKLIGNALSVTTDSAYQIGVARLTDTRIAYMNDTNDQLQTYDWDGTDWTTEGTALTISGNQILYITGLTSNSIAFYSSSIGQIRTYTFDEAGSPASTWSQTGNGLSVGTGTRVALAALSSTEIAALHEGNNDLKKYSWDGTDWTQVGSTATGLNNTGQSTITALNSTDVALIVDGEELRTYRFSGSPGSWSQVGSSYSLGAISNPVVCAFAPNRVVVTHGATSPLSTYQWNGSVWKLIDDSYSLGITNNGQAFVGLNQTNELVFVDGNDSEMSTLRYD